MTSESEDDFQTVGHAKRIPHTPRSKSAPTRKVDPYSSPARRLTPSSRSRLERDHRLAIREGSPSPLSRKMKKEKYLSSPSTRSPTGSRSSMMSLSSSSNTNTTPNKSQSQINSAKTDSNKTQPWSDAENVLLWKAVVKYGDGNINWDEIKTIVNKASTTTRSKSAVSQHWSKLRKDMETHLDPTNSAAHIDATDEDSQIRGRRSITSSRSDVSSSPSSARNLRSRHSSNTVKRE